MSPTRSSHATRSTSSRRHSPASRRSSGTQGNEFFPPTTWQVSNIHAGTGANNVIPGVCEVMFNFRFGSVSSAGRSSSAAPARCWYPRSRHGIDWHLSGKPFITGRGKLVGAFNDAIRDTLGVETELSDDRRHLRLGRFIAEICAEVVEFGPVNASIHKIDEHIATDAIEPLSVVQAHLTALLAPGPL